jgi:hypothetical protein
MPSPVSCSDTYYALERTAGLAGYSSSIARELALTNLVIMSNYLGFGTGVVPRGSPELPGRWQAPVSYYHP